MTTITILLLTAVIEACIWIASRPDVHYMAVRSPKYAPDDSFPPIKGRDY